MKKLFLIASCLFAMVLATSCGGSGASTPADEALKCVKMLQDGNYEALVEEIQFDEDATAEEVEQSKQMLLAMAKDKGAKQIEEKGGITSYEVVEETIAEDGQTAKVKVAVTYGNGKTENEKYDLVNVDGTWKLTLGK